jgi:hypothetical protein
MTHTTEISLPVSGLFKNQVIQDIADLYEQHGVPITFARLAAFTARDVALDLEFLGSEYMALFEQIERTFPGTLEEMAHIEIGFCLN